MAKKIYSVRGTVEDGGDSRLPLAEGAKTVTRSVQLDEADRAEIDLNEIEIDDDDLLEVELEGGFVLWTTIDRLQADTAEGEADRRSVEGNQLLLPSTYPGDVEGVERGVVKNLLRSLKVVDVDIPGMAAEVAAKKIEAKLEEEGKVFRVDEKGGLKADEIEAGDGASLLLIHGTFSSTASAYSGFFSETRDVWKEIYDHYAGRVFGFEHATLSKSPVENAIDLLKALPKEAKLHVVSHSRGGLVGDLLAHGGLGRDAFSKAALDRQLRHSFKDKASRDAARDQYLELNQLLRDKAPSVERYVRAAAPAAGTTFASKRLDVYLSILIHLVEKIPVFGPVLGGLGELTAAVAKKRTEPESLPGLEAQMPKSAFQRLLNESVHELQSDLTVLAGDSNGFPKNLANLFYWRANDLVVDTRSMYAGARRARRLWYLESNKHVTHMNYFSRVETADVVRRGLLRKGSDPAGFQSQAPAGVDRGHVDHGAPEDAPEKTAVVLLPGIMGSHLRAFKDEDDEKGNRIWLDKSDLIKGRARHLELGARRVAPDGVLKRAYDDFRDHLHGRGLHVMPLAYDWRITLHEAADRLNEVVTERLQHSDQPIHLVAHSMGGVVASLFMANHSSTWKKLRASGGRLVQVGTPNRGSYVIARIAQGTEKMVRLLAALDLGQSRRQWAEMASAFPGSLELAPQFGGLDFWDQRTWVRIGAVTPPSQAALDDAKRTADVLDVQRQRLAEEGVVYVAGGPKKTPIWDEGWGEIVWTEQGDGRVTWESGHPEGTPLYFIPDAHGSLLDHKDSFPGLEELILRGATSQLATRLPDVSTALSRSAPTAVPQLADEEEIELIPTQEDLIEAALGMDEMRGLGVPAAPKLRRCRVSVVHGDLRFTSNPVLVGHYKGDSIVHAEQALDECLTGALSTRQQLGIYPGPVGTSDAVFHTAGEASSHGPEGAIVVGLGNVGELTPGGLARTVEKGLLRYGQACRDRGVDTSALEVSSLLVGNGEAGLTVTQILESFLVAVENANRALGKLTSDPSGDASGSAESIFIARLEFIELYHDIALEALHELVSVAARIGAQAEASLGRRDGGRVRSRRSSPSGWWTRLAIQSKAEKEKDDTARPSHQELEFTAYGDRARAARSVVHVQTQLVERMLSEVARSSRQSDPSLPQTLFELLLPPGLKEAAADSRNLQLVLDDASAAYPWELLIDRKSLRNPANAGLLRQLNVTDPPPVSYPEANTILVVGDPKSDLPALPGARREAESIAKKFKARSQWSVIDQVRAETGPPGISARSIISALLSNDIRILHLAGHGHYDEDHPLRSGMVLSGKPNDPGNPGVMLTPAEVSQMRLQPELVFVNCCHLGYIERTPGFYKLASNLASQFIRSGVKAVIAAGWPVNDAAAATFSERFYKEMLEGRDFGHAVRAARQETRDAHRGLNTWGAYQCYGDPGFRLMMDQEVRANATRRHYEASHYLDASELRVELQNLVSRAKTAKTQDDEGGLSERLRQLWSVTTRKGWQTEPGVVAGFGMVEGELGNYERAVEHLEAAKKLERSGLTLTHLEQLASFRTKGAEKKGSRAQAEKAVSELGALNRSFGETSERLSLLAVAHKRVVQVGVKKGSAASKKAARTSLVKMTQSYIEASRLEEGGFWYPATNALLGVALLQGPITKAPRKGSYLASVDWATREDFESKVAAVEAVHEGMDTDEFWSIVARTDFAAIKALADGSLEAKSEALARDYEGAVKIIGSKREVDSVRSQIEFCAQTIEKLWPKSERRESALRGLETLRRALSTS